MSDGDLDVRYRVKMVQVGLLANVKDFSSVTSPIHGVRYYPNIDVLQVDETMILRSLFSYLRTLSDKTPLLLRKGINGVIYLETREETFRDLVEAARKTGAS